MSGRSIIGGIFDNAFTTIFAPRDLIPEQGAFTQSYGSKVLDASLLMMALVGFLPPDDKRVLGTVDAIERHLMVDGLVSRYDTRKAEDGLPEGEGAFLACSFWLVDNLVLLGRLDDARSSVRAASCATE